MAVKDYQLGWKKWAEPITINKINELEKTIWKYNQYLYTAKNIFKEDEKLNYPNAEIDC